MTRRCPCGRPKRRGRYVVPLCVECARRQRQAWLRARCEEIFAPKVEPAPWMVVR